MTGHNIPRPMLLSEARYYQQSINEQPVLYIQPKLDGWRAVVNTRTGTIYSRSGRVLNLPHITADVLSRSDLPEWIDGELYVTGGTCNIIRSAMKNNPLSISLYVFDTIQPGIFSARHRAVKESAHIKPVPTKQIKPSEVQAIYTGYLQQGYEGAVIRADVEYYHGRSEKIWKVKPVY